MIARAGIASRRRAEDIIVEGKVKVNGNVVTVPQHPVLLSGADKVCSLWLNDLTGPQSSPSALRDPHIGLAAHTDLVRVGCVHQPGSNCLAQAAN